MWSRFLRRVGPCAMGSRPATHLPDSGSTAESLCSEARRELAQPPPQSVTLMLRPTAAGDTALMPTNGGGGCGGSRELSPPKVSIGHCVEWGLEGKAVWAQVLRLQDKLVEKADCWEFWIPL